MPVKLNEAVKAANTRIAVYGAAGVGKTSLIATLPGDTLILSAEAGLRSLATCTRTDLEAEEVVDFAHFVSLVKQLRDGSYLNSEGQPWVPTWIALDSFSELVERLNTDNKSKFKGFEVYNKTVDLTNNVLHGLSSLPSNVLYLCKEQKKEERKQVGNTEVVTTYCSAKFPYAEISASLPYQFDFFLRLVVVDEVINGSRQSVRYLQTQKTAEADAKCRGGEHLEQYEAADLKALLRKLSRAEKAALNQVKGE